jgi:hypothetical protein
MVYGMGSAGLSHVFCLLDCLITTK